MQYMEITAYLMINKAGILRKQLNTIHSFLSSCHINFAKKSRSMSLDRINHPPLQALV